MRRPFAASAIAISLGASLLGGVARAEVDHGRPSPAPSPARSATATPSAHDLLRTAQEVLSESAPAPDRSATLALRDLFTVRPRLSSTDRAAADRLLARPGGSRQACGPHVCVHWSTGGADSATGAWARKTLTYMGYVWRKEVGSLGYRAPLKDGEHGGNAKLDVYLQDLGGQGIYGYCAPEYVGRRPGTASGYCVLDNDFAKAQFGVKPVNSLHVTAAHEFFHASQFAYDYREDAWLMEATATWMEEQVADGINDNRQYLPHSQLADPTIPLDWFNGEGVEQYGEWVYFQYLQQLHGRSIVRKIWNQLPGRTHYSISVLDQALKGSFEKQYAGFVAANMTPGKSYPEGKHWPKPYRGSTAVPAGASGGSGTTLDHLTSVGSHLRPGSGLQQRTWHLHVTMHGPAPVTNPMLVVVWQGVSGRIRRYTVPTDEAGLAEKTVRFSSANTKAVYIAAVNASTRYDCRQDASYACQGVSKDDGATFDLAYETVPG